MIPFDLDLFLQVIGYTFLIAAAVIVVTVIISVTLVICATFVAFLTQVMQLRGGDDSNE